MKNDKKKMVTRYLKKKKKKKARKKEKLKEKDGRFGSQISQKVNILII